MIHNRTYAASLITTLAVAGSALIPQAVYAAAGTFEVSAWIPYWKADNGIASIMPQVSSFTEIDPFIYTVKKDGTLSAETPLTSTNWLQLQAAAKAQNVRFVPTVMWSDGDTIDAILRDPASRTLHIQSIVREVYAHNLDGIDIDYEGKLAETNPYFTLFLKELHEAIGYNKWIMCTVEPRMPLDARYENPEEKLKLLAYANDFAALNTYCDRVRIMAYDQGRADVQLNASNADPYIPIADPTWVEKVLRYVMQDIDKDKLELGVPTYGYEYDMFASTGTTSMSYSRLWSFTSNYATGPTGVSTKLGLPVERAPWGEALLTFPASRSPEPEKPIPNATRVLVWSDAQAIAGKIALAQSLGIRGVSIFKIDGAQDPALWGVLEGVKGEGGAGAQKQPDVALARGTEVTIQMPTRDLKLGMRHADVKTLQEFLNNNGFVVAGSGPGSKGSETTYFGPATKDALSRFQKLHNITPASGYYGPKTRAVINGD